MLSISKKTDYALLVLSELAKRPGLYLSLRDLAQSRKMPYRFLAQVVRALIKNDLIESREGAKGGYRLNKPAKKISVRDVVIAVEGGVALAACLNHEAKNCALVSNCPLKKGMPHIQRLILETLGKKTVADLMK